MIIPCIDLQDGKVVQLVQGKKKALEGEAPLRMLEKFAAFGVIQVIDLDAAMGKGSNDAIVRDLAKRATTRVGGGVRSVERAKAVVDAGASRVIVGTAAFSGKGVNEQFLGQLDRAVGRERILLALDTKEGRITIKGWQESVDLTAEEVIRKLEPYCGGFLCTYVDKEGMLQGTDLDWYRRLRNATGHEITAAGGITTIAEIQELAQMKIHSALGMAVYTGRLDLGELAELNRRLAN
ncbi:MAG: 1-(5-phosphoribosyl)-5-[(5-phosphoribosylamino)methylideneamino] imidazole-4-carboxamide isomerase [Acidobacteria bacterium]|nr:1-(5-phosphoribosyl)-5-[(5-phosphoribosylamino)methylideneamino] imidazole-4-carboxamide isomerase [Acidobacteriota bacterium]